MNNFVNFAAITLLQATSKRPEVNLSNLCTGKKDSLGKAQHKRWKKPMPDSL
jgi:hypothetical protein